jgi:hypothetical protein
MFDQGIGLATESAAVGRMLGLWYDPDRLIIEGVYCDEVTAYRARRRWIEALKMHFLLEEGLDFALRVKLLRGERHFKVQCSFSSACGRYAFWRLTHHQALEVQCILETAHLPRPLCSLSVDTLIDEIELSSEMSPELHETTRPSIRRDERPWERALRTIQEVAHRLVKVTRGDARSKSDCGDR